MKKHKHNVNFTDQTPRMNEQELDRITAENNLMTAINAKVDGLKEDFAALNAMNPQLANYLLITYGAATLSCISGFLTMTRNAIYDLDEII